MEARGCDVASVQSPAEEQSDRASGALQSARACATQNNTCVDTLLDQLAHDVDQVHKGKQAQAHRDDRDVSSGHEGPRQHSRDEGPGEQSCALGRDSVEARDSKPGIYDSKANSTVMVITFSTQNCAQAGSQSTRPLPHRT